MKRLVTAFFGLLLTSNLYAQQDTAAEWIF